MSAPAICIDNKASVTDSVQLMFEKDVESLVVVDKDRVICILAFRDLVRGVLLRRRRQASFSSKV